MRNLFQRENQNLISIVSASLFELVIGGCAFLIGWICGINPLGLFQWSWFDAVLGIGVAVGVVLVLIGLIYCEHRKTLNFIRDTKKLLQRMIFGWGPIEFCIISLSAGIGEELFFRGLIQSGLTDLLGGWLGVFIASIAFGMVHWLNNYYFICASIMGAFLGFLYQYTGNLLVPIICHTVYDFLVLLLFYWKFKFLKVDKSQE